MAYWKEYINDAQEIISACNTKGITLTTAESCTGGLLSGAITSIPGCSHVFDRGYVTYSNRAKIDILNVSPTVLDDKGAVSAEIAIQMAKGALANSQANIAISVTGFAGPGGGTHNKPVGLVFIGFCYYKDCFAIRHNFQGSRENIRAATVHACLTELLEIVNVKF